jgi:hypothetical protein
MLECAPNWTHGVTMGGASGVVGRAFGVHPSLILRPWGDDRLRARRAWCCCLFFRRISVLSSPSTTVSVTRRQGCLRPANGSLSAIHASSVGFRRVRSSAWSQKRGSLSQWLIVRPLCLPFPPYDGSPVNLNCLSSAVVCGGSTPVPFSGASAASIKHQCCFSIFAAHAHDSGPNTATYN